MPDPKITRWQRFKDFVTRDIPNVPINKLFSRTKASEKPLIKIDERLRNANRLAELHKYLAAPNENLTKENLNDSLKLVDSLLDPHLGLSPNKLLRLGQALLANPDPKQLTDAELQNFYVKLQNALGSKNNDQLTINYAKFAATVLSKNKFTEKLMDGAFQKEAIEANTATLFSAGISVGLLISILPAAIAAIVVGGAGNVSMWFKGAAGVGSAGIGVLFTSILVMRNTATNRTRIMQITNAKRELYEEFSEQQVNRNIKVLQSIFEKYIADNKEMDANLEKDLAIIRVLNAKNLAELPGKLQATYPDNINRLITAINKQNHDPDIALLNEKALDARKTRRANPLKFWRYMSLGDMATTLGGVGILAGSFFGSYFTLVKLGLLAGAMGGAVSGPGAAIALGVIAGVFLAGATALAMYTYYKNWRYENEKLAVEANTDAQKRICEHGEELQKEIDKINNPELAIESSPSIQLEHTHQNTNADVLVALGGPVPNPAVVPTQMTEIKLDERILILDRQLKALEKQCQEYERAMPKTGRKSSHISVHFDGIKRDASKLHKDLIRLQEQMTKGKIDTQDARLNIEQHESKFQFINASLNRLAVYAKSAQTSSVSMDRSAPQISTTRNAG